MYNADPSSSSRLIALRIKEPATLSKAVAALQRDMIREALESASWKKEQAAKNLGITRQWLNRMIKRHQIQKN